MKQRPTVSVEDTGVITDYKIEHPAFGIIEVSKQTGTDRELFGSELGHSSRICITLYKASEERYHGHSRYCTDNRIAEFVMSESQWARFVSSSGISEGTPCTLNAYQQGNYVRLPEIEGQKNARQKASLEFKRDVLKTMEKGKKLEQKVAELIEKGKAGKQELKELLGMVQQSLGRFEDDAQYAAEVFEKQIEKIVDSGKLELEAHLSQTAQRIGLDSLKGGNYLTYKE